MCVKCLQFSINRKQYLLIKLPPNFNTNFIKTASQMFETSDLDQTCDSIIQNMHQSEKTQLQAKLCVIQEKVIGDKSNQISNEQCQNLLKESQKILRQLQIIQQQQRVRRRKKFHEIFERIILKSSRVHLQGLIQKPSKNQEDLSISEQKYEEWILKLGESQEIESQLGAKIIERVDKKKEGRHCLPKKEKPA